MKQMQRCAALNGAWLVDQLPRVQLSLRTVLATLQLATAVPALLMREVHMNS